MIYGGAGLASSWEVSRGNFNPIKMKALARGWHIAKAFRGLTNVILKSRWRDGG
jgi:hypothetical protein